jgi:hypothetical protein
MFTKSILFFICVFATSAYSQFHELGLFLGSSNYVGDIGTDQYIDPNSPALGLVYRWNVTDRYSLRGGFTFTKLTETEYNNNDLNRSRRSYIVDNNIQEATVGIEFNFKEFNLHDDDFSFTPYLFYGLSYFRYDQYYILPNGQFNPPNLTNYGKDEKIAIPFIMGVKFNPNPLFILGFEVGARYALTDNLDGSNPENQFANQLDYKFGNIANNDWYIFMGFTISFTFGDLPCYCKE